MSHRVFLGTGSNLGDRMANLQKAIDALNSIAIIDQKSKVYETKPWGFTDQPAFLNQVLSATTDLDPFDLLASIKAMENEIGRTPTFRYGPRIIDMDILFFDDLVLDEERLTIPHSHITERAFVMVPLHEIAPQLIHPRLQRTIHDLIAGMDVSDVGLYEGSPQEEQ
ncbi:MAG: 2-amino-4-hydroxy-6-hydroxymethyldihydropteridine diphosphokinase [Anaerolineaceae bacterium]